MADSRSGGESGAQSAAKLTADAERCRVNGRLQERRREWRAERCQAHGRRRRRRQWRRAEHCRQTADAESGGECDTQNAAE